MFIWFNNLNINLIYTFLFFRQMSCLCISFIYKLHINTLKASKTKQNKKII